MARTTRATPTPTPTAAAIDRPDGVLSAEKAGAEAEAVAVMDAEESVWDDADADADVAAPAELLCDILCKRSLDRHAIWISGAWMRNSAEEVDVFADGKV